MKHALKDLVDSYFALKLKSNFAVRDGWLLNCQPTSVTGFSVQRRNSTGCKIEYSHLLRSFKKGFPWEHSSGSRLVSFPFSGESGLALIYAARYAPYQVSERHRSIDYNMVP